MYFISLPSGLQPGIRNMAIDDALLDYVRARQETEIMVVRTYGWSQQTVSIGVHQSTKDFEQLAKTYCTESGQSISWVRRPTGGRAILHGADVSYSVATNASFLLKQSVSDSYCTLTKMLKQALSAIEVPWTDCAADASESSRSEYVRSPLCMETRMPTDMTDASGEKRLGSAQVRRAGGMLQHGAIFLPEALNLPLDEQLNRFHQALLTAVGDTLQAEQWHAADDTWLQTETDVIARMETYARSASGILDSTSTSIGSHFVPAS